MKTSNEGIFKAVRWMISAVFVLIIALPAIASVSTYV